MTPSRAHTMARGRWWSGTLHSSVRQFCLLKGYES
jgi:hypothetical protein